MTPSESILWDKIQGFRFDDPQASFSFSARLARENGWKNNYTLRVIEEYRKFIFLCCTTESGITPSDPVDQVWHLHLTYTKSYWIDFCKNTLEKEIHHNPTKGGQSEAVKFNEFYSHSREVYMSKFGEEPPPDIWHPNHIRFTDINFQRINLKKYWLIKKPGKIFKQQSVIAGLVLTGLLSIYAMPTALFFFAMVVGFIVIRGLYSWGTRKNNRRKNTGGGSGCSGGYGCSSGCSGGHHGSGCSGCSGSGCSGCGGGGD